MADKRTLSVAQLRRMSKLGDAASSALQAGLRPVRNLGFPYRKPTVPRGVVVPAEPSKLGANFETDWARKAPARVVRTAINRGPLQAFVKAVADPETDGVDRLADLMDQDPAPAVIFAPNHHSHVDTPLIITAAPEPWRSKLVVAAAADYFFDKKVKGTLAALALNAFPIEREVTTRNSSRLAMQVR